MLLHLWLRNTENMVQMVFIFPKHTWKAAHLIKQRLFSAVCVSSKTTLSAQADGNGAVLNSRFKNHQITRKCRHKYHLFSYFTFYKTCTNTNSNVLKRSGSMDLDHQMAVDKLMEVWWKAPKLITSYAACLHSLLFCFVVYFEGSESHLHNWPSYF